jgi:hypothetical protein
MCSTMNSDVVVAITAGVFDADACTGAVESKEIQRRGHSTIARRGRGCWLREVAQWLVGVSWPAERKCGRGTRGAGCGWVWARRGYEVGEYAQGG